MTLFRDRPDAFNKLVTTMPIERLKFEHWVVLAISSGGVFFADQIAKRIDAEADYLFTEGLYAPNNKECVIAMVSETEELVINHNLCDSFGITLDYLYGEAKRKYDENILSYTYKYRKGAGLMSLKDRNVLIVDEGADTGMTLMASLKTVLAAGASKVAVALPIVPESIAIELEKIVDEVFFAHQVRNYVDLQSYFKELPKFDALAYGELNSQYCRLIY